MSAAPRRALALGVVVLLALGAGFGHALAARRDAAEKRRRTLETLGKLAWLIQHRDLGDTTVDSPPPRAAGSREDPTGMLAVHEYLMGGHYLLESEPETIASEFLRGELADDAWGRPIRYRSPGRRERWEFSSLGADGEDDEGEGDDLVVGPSGAR